MEILINYLALSNIDFNASDIDKLRRYYELLIEYNGRFNLTAITDYEEVQTKHFIDSLAALEYLKSVKSVVDIGTGAGFPSIPLAIFLPSVRFTLVDSLNKRVTFLKSVIDELGLDNVTAVHSRAEDLDKSVLYDAAVARAVAPLNILLELIAPFIKLGGKALIYKGSGYTEELENAKNAADTLGVKLKEIHEFTLFNTDIRRVLLEYDKYKKSPHIYPRGQNKPRKQPL